MFEQKEVKAIFKKIVCAAIFVRQGKISPKYTKTGHFKNTIKNKILKIFYISGLCASFFFCRPAQVIFKDLNSTFELSY